MLAAGWRPEHLVDFTPRETADEMRALIDKASPLADFGSEITMMRRCLDEAQRGTRWLLVKAEGKDTLQRLGDMARQHGARLAVACAPPTAPVVLQGRPRAGCRWSSRQVLHLRLFAQ